LIKLVYNIVMIKINHCNIFETLVVRNS